MKVQDFEFPAIDTVTAQIGYVIGMRIDYPLHCKPNTRPQQEAST